MFDEISKDILIRIAVDYNHNPGLLYNFMDGKPERDSSMTCKSLGGGSISSGSYAVYG